MLALGVLVGLFEPPPAHACPQLEFDIDIIFPAPGTTEAPRNAALVAVVQAGPPKTVVLRRGDGVVIETDWGHEGSTDGAVLLAWPLEPLEAFTIYTWEINDTWAFSFNTSAQLDDGPPSTEPIDATYQGMGVTYGCAAQDVYVFDVRVHASEPVAIVVRSGNHPVGWGLAPEVVAQQTIAAGCFDADVIDRAGHRVHAGEHCFDVSDLGESSDTGSDMATSMTGGSSGLDPAETTDAGAPMADGVGCACSSFRGSRPAQGLAALALGLIIVGRLSSLGERPSTTSRQRLGR